MYRRNLPFLNAVNRLRVPELLFLGVWNCLTGAGERTVRRVLAFLAKQRCERDALMPRRSDWRAAVHQYKSEDYQSISPRPTERAKGTTLLELIVVLGVIGVLCAMAAPIFKNSFSSAHLSTATSAVSGAIQGTRYRAIVSGCNAQIVFSQSTTTYQVTAYALSGTPPSCATTYTNVGGAISWSGAGNGVTLLASTTLQFTPAGLVSLVSGGSTGCATNVIGCLKLSNGSTTSTINVSGVGNVTVTSP